MVCLTRQINVLNAVGVKIINFVLKCPRTGVGFWPEPRCMCCFGSVSGDLKEHP